VHPAARHAQVKIDWQPPAERCVVAGDSAALSQLLINLFVNAVEAAEQGTVRNQTPGRVVIELSQRSHGRLALTISDSGPGPPAEIGEQLFEPFITAKANGVGLGLSVASEVSRRHGGRIDWKRIDGMTQFIVELPTKKMELQCA
jgi:C4-dicarboxylate-specific signal transduction histidine kinase